MSICQIYDLCAETLWLGRYGENGARDIAIDVGKWFADLGAEGTVVLVSWRPGEDDTPYNPNVTMDGSKVVWSPSSIDLAISGRGFAELRYYVGNALAKSKTFRTVIDRTPSEGANPPSAAEDWLERMEDAAVTAQTASETAVDAAETATEGAQAVAQALPTVTQAAQTATTAAATATSAATEAAASEEVASAAANAAQTASETATAASQTAVGAASTATTKAAQAVEAAGTATAKASEATQAATTATANAQTSTVKAGEATTAAATATSRATEATTAASTASAAATTATSAASTATSAASTATAAKTAAQTAQTVAETAQTAAESAAASVSASAAQIATNTSDITELKADLSEIGYETYANEIPKGTIVDNEYVKTTGEFAEYGGWSRTGYIDITDCTKLKINITANYCAFYDSGYVFVGQAPFVANTDLSIPTLAKYIAISSTTVEMTTLSITATKKGKGLVLQGNVASVDAVVNSLLTVNPSAIIDGYLINGAGNAIKSSDWVCTNYLDLPFNEVSDFTVAGTFYGIGGCAIYGANKNLLLYINGSNVSVYGGTTLAGIQTISVPYVEGMRYIRISAWKSKYTTLTDIGVTGSTIGGAFERIVDLENDVIALNANVSTTISESKVLVMGDSISTDSYGNYKKWVTRLIESGFFPSDTTNSSRHATGFVARYNNEANDFITRIKAIENPSQYDLVVIFGGINDYIQNIPMGEETGTDYTVSFKPAVNEFFDYLIQNFMQARICVLLPLRTYATWKNSVNEYQQSYGDYIKTVAKKYCLPVLNLTDDSGFCPFIATFSDMWTLLPEGFQSHDGVHPNEEYERRFLAPMIKHFLQGLM